MPQPYGETEPGTASLPPAEIRQLAQLSPNQIPPPWSPLARKSNCFFMLLFSKSESSMKVSEWQSQRPLLRFSYQGGWENKFLSSALAKCVMWENTRMKKLLDWPPRLIFPCYLSLQSQLPFSSLPRSGPQVNSVTHNQNQYSCSVYLYG